MDGRFLQGTFNARLGVNDVRPDVSCGAGRHRLRSTQDGQLNAGAWRRQRAIHQHQNRPRDLARRGDA